MLINIHEQNRRHWTVKAQRRQKLIHIRKSGFAIRRLLGVINIHELSVGFVISPQDGVRGVGTTSLLLHTRTVTLERGIWQLVESSAFSTFRDTPVEQSCYRYTWNIYSDCAVSLLLTPLKTTISAMMMHSKTSIIHFMIKINNI